MRALGATQTNKSDPYPFVNFMDDLSNLGEAPFSQSQVFNFFPPQYVIPQADINSPEFGLENTGSIIPRLSLADKIIHSGIAGLTSGFERNKRRREKTRRIQHNWRTTLDALHAQPDAEQTCEAISSRLFPPFPSPICSRGRGLRSFSWSRPRNTRSFTSAQKKQKEFHA